MKYVIEQVRKRENRQMQHVVRMEIDYELVTLFDALEANNDAGVNKSKEKLTYLVKKLKALSKK